MVQVRPQSLEPALRRLARFALSALMGVALGVTGCGPAAAPRTVVMALDGVPLTLDPHLHNDAVTWSVLASFYEGLVRFTDDMRIEPALASRWQRSDPATWRFTLREGARFSGGAPVRAADVVASFRRARDNPGSRLRHHLLGITRMLAEDDRTVVVETDGPQPTLLNRLAFLMVLPEAMASSTELTSIDGSGAYRLESFDPQRSLVAVAWPGAAEQAAVRRVRMLFSWDLDELVRDFLAGEIDVLRQLPESRLPDLRTRPRLRAELQPRLQVQMLAICPQAAPAEAARALGDSRVRLALLLAMDRGRYAREVFRGNAVAASQYVQPVVFGYDPALQPREFDPERARSLLAAAGYPGGFTVALGYTSGQRELVTPMIADLQRVGVRVQGREMSWVELLQRARSHQSELTVFGWACSTGDASDFLNACVHTPVQERGLGVENYSGYSDATTDALIDAAEREMSSGQRLRLLQAAQSRLASELPILPITVRFGRLGVSDRVEVPPRHDQWLLPRTFLWTEGQP